MFEELVSFLTLKLKETDITKDLVLICGDFNVYRYPVNGGQHKVLYAENSEWVDYFGLIDDEYDHLVKTLSA